MFTESKELYDAIYATIKDYPKEAALLAELLRREHPACRSVLDVASGTGEHLRRLMQAHRFHGDGLFSPPEMIDAFEASGLELQHDPIGLDGRDLYTARGAA